jgi:hypothetical protein
MSKAEEELQRRADNDFASLEFAVFSDRVRDVVAGELLRRGVSAPAVQAMADKTEGHRKIDFDLFETDPQDALRTRITKEPLTVRMGFDLFTSGLESALNNKDFAIAQNFARELGTQRSDEDIALSARREFYSRDFKGRADLLRHLGRHMSPENRAALPSGAVVKRG